MIRMFCCDSDGTLTDGKISYQETENGFIRKAKKFNIRDGHGFYLLRQNNIITVIISWDCGNQLKARSIDLRVDFLKNNQYNSKLETLRALIALANIKMSEVAYIGDDLPDKECLEAVGLAACPPDAHDDVKSIEGIIILKNKSGEGCVREFIDYVLKVNKLEEII